MIYFVLDVSFPIDANCKMRITFPTEEPYTTDLTMLYGDDSIVKTIGSTSITASASSNYIEYTGCDNYIDESKSQGMLIYL